MSSALPEYPQTQVGGYTYVIPVAYLSHPDHKDILHGVCTQLKQIRAILLIFLLSRFNILLGFDPRSKLLQGNTLGLVSINVDFFAPALKYAPIYILISGIYTIQRSQKRPSKRCKIYVVLLKWLGMM